MLVKEGKRRDILEEGVAGYRAVYRGILELMGRFGYVSLDELIYGFDLSEQEARDRFKYLVREGLIRRFPSLAAPLYFYCLTTDGLAALRSYAISDEIHEFDSDAYRPYHQKHDRTLIRVFLALKKALGPDFQGWLSERSIRKGESLKLILEAHREKRVLDGLFQVKVHKKKFTQNPQGDLVFHDSAVESWWCGLELELSIKSKARYQRQFKALSECVYDRINDKQKIPLMLFLSGSPTIQETLIKYQQERTESFGRCIFIYGQVDQFLSERKKSVFVQFMGSKFREIVWEEINHVKTKVSA